MKKNILTSLLLSGFLQAQVGINTLTPKATLDISAKNTTGTSTENEGILTARVDRERAQNMLGTTISTLIYVDNI